MKIVGARVDALTIACRVALDGQFVAALKERQQVVQRHGRAEFSWTVEVPDTGMGDMTAQRLGGHPNGGRPLRARWSNDFDRVKRVSKIWGELQYSAVRGVYRITNQPFFRMQIKERAEGEKLGRPCVACNGTGRRLGPSLHRPMALEWEKCEGCDGGGLIREAGWTFEVIWYARELAKSGLERCFQESQAMASQVGEVFETRLRRIDLCADVAGWKIYDKDVWNIDKRPRAKWTKNPNDAVANDVNEGWSKPSRKERREKPLRRETFGRKLNTTRRINGLAVGRGGPLQCRIYDKREELELDTIGDRRREEEARWKANGWDGKAPVARVEFQLQGEAIKEFGIRDPDACVAPVVKHEVYTDRRGRQRMRNIVVGQEIIVAKEDAAEVQATIVHRVPAIWATCLRWVRLVVPQKSRNGAAIPVTRLKDDKRWSLLQDARFDERERFTPPIRRHRARKCANAAQALGVALSQAGADGRLHHRVSEHLADYHDDPRAESRLLARVLALKAAEARRIVDDMIDRFGGIAEASVHYAVRHNAARAKHWAGVETVIHHASRPPPLEPDLDGGEMNFVSLHDLRRRAAG